MMTQKCAETMPTQSKVLRSFKTSTQKTKHPDDNLRKIVTAPQNPSSRFTTAVCQEFNQRKKHRRLSYHRCTNEKTKYRKPKNQTNINNNLRKSQKQRLISAVPILPSILTEKKPSYIAFSVLRHSTPPPWLPDKDSNLDKKSQNLLCYRYTIGQNTASTLQKSERMSRAVAVPRNRFINRFFNDSRNHQAATPP